MLQRFKKVNHWSEEANTKRKVQTKYSIEMTSIVSVSAAFSKDLYSKTPKEDEVVMISNGENEVSAQPVITAEILGDSKCSSGDFKHPSIPGWFSEYCPIWPGESFNHFQSIKLSLMTLFLRIMDYILICSDIYIN